MVYCDLIFFRAILQINSLKVIQSLRFSALISSLVTPSEFYMFLTLYDSLYTAYFNFNKFKIRCEYINRSLKNVMRN